MTGGPRRAWLNWLARQPVNRALRPHTYAPNVLLESLTSTPSGRPLYVGRMRQGIGPILGGGSLVGWVLAPTRPIGPRNCVGASTHPTAGTGFPQQKLLGSAGLSHRRRTIGLALLDVKNQVQFGDGEDLADLRAESAQ